MVFVQIIQVRIYTKKFNVDFFSSRFNVWYRYLIKDIKNSPMHIKSKKEKKTPCNKRRFIKLQNI